MPGVRSRESRPGGNHGVKRHDVGSKRRLRRLTLRAHTPLRVWVVIIGFGLLVLIGAIWLAKHPVIYLAREDLALLRPQHAGEAAASASGLGVRARRATSPSGPTPPSWLRTSDDLSRSRLPGHGLRRAGRDTRVVMQLGMIGLADGRQHGSPVIRGGHQCVVFDRLARGGRGARCKAKASAPPPSRTS